MKDKKMRVILLVMICVSFGLFVYPQTEVKESSVSKPIDKMEDEKPIDKIIERGDGTEKILESETIGNEIPILGANAERRAILKAEFLALGNLKIHRFKPAIRLTDEEILAYLAFVRDGKIFKGIDDIGHVAVIESGSELMKHITYDHLIKVLAAVYKKVKKDTKTLKIPPLFVQDKTRFRFSNEIVNELIQNNEEVRRKVIESVLGGLLNPDPRVRLVSVNLLRRLIPEPVTWEFVNERIKEQDFGIPYDPISDIDASSLETVKTMPYFFKNINSIDSDKVIYIELLKLRRFISRFILENQIRSGDMDTIRSIPIEVFKLLNRPIEGEGYCRIPMNNFSSSVEVEVIIEGLKNSDVAVQRGCADSLIRIVRTRGTNFDMKKGIFMILLKSSQQNKVATDWSDEEINDLSQDDVGKMVRAYLKKVKLINPCIQDAEDLYDAEDPLGYKSPTSFIDKPISKDDVDLRVDFMDKVTTTKKKKEILEETYIFE